MCQNSATMFVDYIVAGCKSVKLSSARYFSLGAPRRIGVSLGVKAELGIARLELMPKIFHECQISLLRATQVNAIVYIACADPQYNRCGSFTIGASMTMFKSPRRNRPSTQRLQIRLHLILALASGFFLAPALADQTSVIKPV